MKLVWTKSSLPLSVLIRAITGEDCSHFAIVFESSAKGIMFESNLMGTHPKFWANAQKHMTVVHSMDLNLTIDDEDKLWDLIVDKFDDRPYDFMGAIYLGLCILRERILKVPRPLINHWAKSDLFFCDEIYDAFNQVGLCAPLDVASGMETPFEVWENLNHVIT